MVFGIASWRGFRVSFTDGMCVGCGARFRRQWNLPETPTGVASVAPGMGLVRVAATMVMVAGFILAARPLDDVRTPPTVTAPPETVLVPPVPVDEESSPSLAVPYAPRRVRTVVPRVGAVSSPRVSSAATASESPAISDPVVSVANTAIEPVSATATTARVPAATAFIALPHAGLTQQTP